MSITSIISMIIILTTIVGGFIYFLSIAMRKEKELADSDQDTLP